MRRFVVICAIAANLVFFSCTEPIDSAQVEDLNVTPTLEASLLYIEASEGVINSSTDTSVFSNDFNFDAFSTELFAERVIDGSITYVITNTTSKDLQIEVEFLDEAQNVLDTEFFNIEAAPSTVIQREIFYGPSGRSLDIIRNLTEIRVNAVNLGDTTSTSTENDPMIILQSSAKFRVRVR